MLRLLFLWLLLLSAFYANASTHELRASVEVNRTEAYVNEQILVTVRVAAPANAFKITKPNLEIENVELHALHKLDYDETINGSSFKVSEVVYAVFVQEAGERTIASLSFNATLPITEDGVRSNPILSAETRPQKLNIISPPASNASWLPAQSVSLSSVWSNEYNTDFRAGEPVTRIISIDIKGQHPAAIPEIALPDATGIKSYPDIPQLEVQKSATGFGGTQTKSVTLIVENAGTVSLPSLSLDWWDINDRSWKQATLAAQDVVVQPASESLAWVGERNRYRWALLLLSCAVLGLATLSTMLWRKRRLAEVSKGTHAKGTKPALSEKTAWSNLRRSLKQQHPVRVRTDLLLWARLRWPALCITRLDQLEYIDNDLASSAFKLNDSLYGKDPKLAADYEAIKQAVQRLRKIETRNAGQIADEARQKLYPER